MKLKKRIAALLMAGAMVCSTLPVNVLAVENSNQNVGGLCEHHTEHNADCGYTEGIEGRPCGYICGECDVEDEPETATPSNAAQLSAGDVQKLIDALPATDKLTTMTKDEQNAVYADLQAAYEAYETLTEDEQALLTGTEVFESLFHFFNGMVNLLAENGVSYLDENGSKQTADNVTVVESGTTAWNGGWYVVNGSVTISERVTVSGDVRLILEDGAVLTINRGIQVQDDDRDPSNGSANKLTIYAQSDKENMGALTANGNNGGAGIGGGDSGSGGNITINGLEADTYYLHEVAAPDGYNKLADPVKVEIQVTGQDGADSAPSYDVPVYVISIGEEAGTSSTNNVVGIENKSGTMLPETGGIGTIPGAMVGALIMGVLNQGLSIMGVDAAWVKTIKGLVVIAAVAYDLLSKKKKG